ncbi:hypothetical protein T11_17423 [Trichinella zimbabwensis]|uniref:Uncharacterized protein n=1 Tax=Trichinella zimbabwensis TaxID=268475 RepID=A0A0V1H3Q3_9BILA|nr:hypothetical protein T11_17423 [Trichinella zimbabwensis]
MGYFSNLLECFTDVHAVAGAVYPSGLKNHMNRILFAFVSETNLSKLARDVDDYNCRRCRTVSHSKWAYIGADRRSQMAVQPNSTKQWLLSLSGKRRVTAACMDSLAS